LGNYVTTAASVRGHSSAYFQREVSPQCVVISQDRSSSPGCSTRESMPHSGSDP
jgi:hypothetical protein